MSWSASTFRAAFPEFSSAVQYPDAMLTYRLTVAAQLVNADRWGELTDHGVALVTSHMLVLAAKAIRASSGNNGIPGAPGVLNSKSGGGVSASYDLSSITAQGASYWNATTYGIEYYRMAQLFGAGPVQVGADQTGASISGAWPGPYFY